MNIMTNLEAKQEAIKKAYSEYWEKVKDYVDNDGYIDNSIPKFTFGQVKNLDLEYKNDVFFRPKSLQGIENNNGWIKIESEKDLPKVSGLYFGKDYEFGTDMMYFDFETKKWEDSNGYLQNITHYQPIEKPKPPIY